MYVSDKHDKCEVYKVFVNDFPQARRRQAHSQRRANRRMGVSFELHLRQTFRNLLVYFIMQIAQNAIRQSCRRVLFLNVTARIGLRLHQHQQHIHSSLLASLSIFYAIINPQYMSQACKQVLEFVICIVLYTSKSWG